MTVSSTFNPMSTSVLAPLPGVQPVAMSRPQVGIERLPARRLSNEPRESMNCKSCRKRKIKCNRLRPSCEACQVFQCPCIYDAVPKKRGPKTDVLEALLKRVDGLEQQLKDQKKPDGSPNTDESQSLNADDTLSNAGSSEAAAMATTAATTTAGSSLEPKPKRPTVDTSHLNETGDTAVYTPTASGEVSPGVAADALLDTYFSRFHAKPFHILDESSVRQRLQVNQLPGYLLHAIYAVAARYTPHPNGYQSAVKLSEHHASRARSDVAIDEPSVDALQAVLLLVVAFTAAGKGKKAYMLMANAVGMAMALELHREVDPNSHITPVEREMRRRLFWTCYLLDKFMSCGSKRPSLIGDKTVLLRLPYWSPHPAGLPIEGEFFQSGSNLHYLQGGGKRSQGSSGMLIDITRILGITNRYLAAGGVKGDSHFPWHTLSNLSQIRHDLDIWALGTEEMFSSIDTLFGQPDSTVLVLSKLIYHLIYCLIYRPFLPIDLAELAGSGQHQSWQIEATNMCFMHANAIAELVELGKQTATIEWPAFVGYCICTAGTVHIHGAHYNNNGVTDTGAFASSSDFLSREMQQLSELRYAWASVQHQRETLQGIYNAHAELVKNLANNPSRYAPVFHLEDFFDRYANMGQAFTFDAANQSLSDLVQQDFATDTYTGHDLYAPRSEPTERPNLKRKITSSMGRKRPDIRNLAPLSSSTISNLPPATGLPTPSSHDSFSNAPGPHPSPMIHSPIDQLTQPLHPMRDVRDAKAFSLPSQHHVTHLSTSPYSPSPSYNFTAAAPTSDNSGGSLNVTGYDPMFGAMPTNAFPSPATWHGDENRNMGQVNVDPSPRAPSHNGGEEKDPFLNLLEQLAENEHAQGQHNIDVFLAGAQN